MIDHPVTSYRSTSGPGEAWWLIIFDNDDLVELLSEYWPANSCGSVLITSRDPAARDFCRGSGTILQQLPSAETSELFLKLLNKDLKDPWYTESDIESLLKRFSGLPLAIVQIASLIRRGSTTIR
jgi:hypothetical protein